MSVLIRALPLLAIVIGFAAGDAAADTTAAEMNQAKVLFERGRELVKKTDFEHACPLFEESERIVAALGTELNLAECWAKIGKLIAARDLFRQVIDKSIAAKQDARADVAKKDLDELLAHLPKLQIDLQGATATVEIDGTRVDASQPIEVDPGPHKVVAVDSSGGHAETTAVAKPDETTTVALTIVKAPDPHPVPPPPKVERTGPRTRKKLALGLAAAGGAAYITSLTFGEIARHRSRGLDSCETDDNVASCLPGDAARLRSAKNAANQSTLTFVLGTALGGAAACVFFTSPRENRVVPAVSATGAGVVFEGSW